MLSRRIQQRVRQFVTAIMRPLARSGLSPNILTLLGLLLSMITAVVIAQGSLFIGGLLVLFAGIFDMFDGALARARHAATIFGAFFDSTLDRYSESIILFGLLWYAIHTPELHDNLWPLPYEQSWMISLLYIAVVGSLMVSYTKARAEGLGLECKTGLLARPERVVILAIGLITGTGIWAVLLLAVFANVTTVERIAYIWRVTRRVAMQLEASKVSTDEQASSRENNADHRTLPVGTNEGVEPSLRTVQPAVPPFSGSVQQD